MSRNVRGSSGLSIRRNTKMSHRLVKLSANTQELINNNTAMVVGNIIFSEKRLYLLTDCM